jgi:hypothetical protein
VLPLVLFAFVVFLLARGRLGVYYALATTTRASNASAASPASPAPASDPFSGGGPFKLSDIFPGSDFNNYTGAISGSQDNQALSPGAVLGQ